MPPKKKNNKKRNSIVPVAKENGDADPLNSPAPGTPAEEKDQEFVTPADRLDNPLDAPITNGATSTPAEVVDEKSKEGAIDAMARAEGDEEAAAWGLDGEKTKVFDEPDYLPDTGYGLDNGVEDVPPENPRFQEPAAESAEAEVKPVDHAAEEGPAATEVKEETREVTSEDHAPAGAGDAPPVDLDIPDTVDAKEPIVEESTTDKPAVEASVAEPTPEKTAPEESAPEETAPEEPAPAYAPEDPAIAKSAVEEDGVKEPPSEEPAAEEPAVEKASVEETPVEVEPAAAAEAPAEVEPESKTEEPEATKEPTDAVEPEPTATGEVVEGEADPEAKVEEPSSHGRPVMEAPKETTLPSLTSANRDFTSSRYQSTTSPRFLNKPHQPANHSLDLDDRNMQSSVNNWYKKVFSFADGLKWRPGWDHLEEFGFLAKTLENPLSQISLHPLQEWLAEKPKDPNVDWDNINDQDAKYEEFWEWKSKTALAAICGNFACREIFGKTVFGLDAKMTKQLGMAMSVFSNEFGDDITATKFRHLTLKLLQESRAFQSASRKQLVHLSQELANVLSPLTSFMEVPPPRTEEEKQQQVHYTPLTLALYEKVLSATLNLHDTIQKDHHYYALFHPVPGVEFDDMTMEESTFEGIGAGKGSVALVSRPGLARLGLPRGGEPEDIVIVHKALVVREGALEDATSYFSEQQSQPPA